MAKELRVLIGVPGSSWHPNCGLSLLGLEAYFVQNRIPGVSLQTLSFSSVRGSMLPQIRTEIAEKAVETQSTHLLFVDSDQSFPADLLHRLLAWKVPVVACNIASKQFPSCPTARDQDPDDPSGKIVYTYPKDKGLRQVWRVGTGIMLIDCAVFRFLEPPWFGMRWDWHQLLQKRFLVGEDWWFCERVNQAGYRIFIDHGLSNQVRHHGEIDFGMEMCIGELIAQEAYEDAARSGSEVQSENQQGRVEDSVSL